MALFAVYRTNRNSPSYLDNVAGERIISVDFSWISAGTVSTSGHDVVAKGAVAQYCPLREGQDLDRAPSTGNFSYPREYTPIGFPKAEPNE
jgi:hypothetical protein